ncbi:hypothetical protein AB0A71_41360 [Kitasatospora aureofaciens]|uniref:hypothetical protein n=1 Tax=Kitasatospora aureofaciens TaxID=1894 RepID=UPI0033FC1D01
MKRMLSAAAVFAIAATIIAAPAQASPLPDASPGSQWLIDSSGNVDDPVAEPTIIQGMESATGPEADKLTAALAAILPAGAIVEQLTTETYEEAGQQVHGTAWVDGKPLSISRFRLPKAVPTFAFGSAKESTEQGVVVAESMADSNQVALISDDGTATVWSSSQTTTSAINADQPGAAAAVIAPLTTAEFRNWALALNKQVPVTGEVIRAAAAPAKARALASGPTCTASALQVWQRGDTIQGGVKLECSEVGYMNLAASVYQYRGFWVWRQKATDMIVKEWIQYGYVNPTYYCSGSGSQLYRLESGTASLRNGTGKSWTMGGRYHGAERRFRC